MRTNEERQQLIYRRTVEIQKEQRKRRQQMLSGAGVAACLVIIIGMGCLLSGLTKQESVARMDYMTSMASMLGNYKALGYICMGILAFALGVCVTVLLYRLRRIEEHRQKAEEYKQLEKIHEDKVKEGCKNGEK